MIDKNTKSFSDMPTPAEAINPNVLTILVIMRKDKLDKKSCSAMGEPTFKIRLIDAYCFAIAPGRKMGADDAVYNIWKRSRLQPEL